MLKLPRGLKHTIWSLLDTITYPVIYFALTPFLIRYMGTVVFGFWMVLNTLTTVLQLFNFNLGYTAMRHIAHERATGSKQLVTDIINSLLKITFFQFLGVVVIGAALVLVMSAIGWPGEYVVHFRYGALCFFLAAMLAGLKYFEQVFQNIVKSYDHFRGAALLNMVYRIGSLGVTLIIAVLFPKMIVYVLVGNVVFGLCYLAIHYAYIRRVLPFYKPAPVEEGGLQKRLLRYSFWPWIQSIFIVLTFQGDRFWVSGYAGLSEVSAYALIATMFNHIHMIFTAMVAWIFPRIIGMHARSEHTGEEYQFVRSLLTVIAIVSLLVFYWISPVLFRMWLGAETYGHIRPYVQVFTGFEIAFVHTIMPVFYLNGTGRERAATYVTLLCCSACYILMLGGLWIFESPVALVQGMTIGACLTVPLFNMVSNSHIAGLPRNGAVLLEMLPVFAAVGLIYSSSPILILTLVAVGGWALWRFYLVHLVNRNVWRNVLGG